MGQCHMGLIGTGELFGSSFCKRHLVNEPVKPVRPLLFSRRKPPARSKARLSPPTNQAYSVYVFRVYLLIKPYVVSVPKLLLIQDIVIP